MTATLVKADKKGGGVKADGLKVRMDLVPGEFIYGVAAAMTYGSLKYDDWNWALGMKTGRVLAALLRHVTLRLMGEMLDEESNLPHMWHAGACVCMVIGSEARGTAINDIPDAQCAIKLVQKQFAAMNIPKKVIKDE